MATISMHVALDLLNPIGRIVPNRELLQSFLEITTMPEVAIDKHNETMACEDDVRTTG